MIHRYVDLLEQLPQGTPIWPIMVGSSASGDTNWYVYLIGEGLPPYQLTLSQQPRAGGGSGLADSLISDPRLSPDESEVIYGRTKDPNVGANTAQIFWTATDDSDEDPVGSDSVAPFTAGFAMGCDWHPTGDPIYFCSFPASLPGTMRVKKINRDGTGLTTLYTPSPNGSVTQVTVSPSGDYVAFWVTRSSTSELVVMEDDGLNPTVVYTGISALTGTEIAPAWQHGADVLAFLDLDNTTPQNAGTIRKVNADGTGLATLVSDSSAEYSHLERLAWLSDDSSLVCYKRTDGTSFLDATLWDLVLIDGSTGAVTNTGFDTGSAGTRATTKAPFVAITSREDPRIYWTMNPLSARKIVSVKEDLTDFRTDFDPSTLTSKTTYGISGRSDN